MNSKEKQLAAKMLENHSSRLGNNFCNDFDFPENWSKEEIKIFVKEYHEWNGDPEEFEESRLYLADFAVSSFLARKLKGAGSDS